MSETGNRPDAGAPFASAGPGPSPIARVARIIADRPKLKPIALGLLRDFGPAGTAEAAREIEWLAAHVR